MVNFKINLLDIWLKKNTFISYITVVLMYRAEDNRSFINELRPQSINLTLHKGKITVDCCLKIRENLQRSTFPNFAKICGLVLIIC